MKKILFFGPPGAGKGTQSKLLAKDFNLSHLSTGDILRSKIQKQDELGLKVKNILASGKLVSDEILNAIVSEKINETISGFILDGYPRTVDQLFFLEEFFSTKKISLDCIFNINLDTESF